MKIFAVTDVEITSAAPEELLNSAIGCGIVFHSVEQVDALRIRTSVSGDHIATLRKIVVSRGDQIRFLKSQGIKPAIGRILRRPVLLIGILLWLILLLYLPTRIMFVEVEGNQSVSTLELIDRAQSCGIYFGASRRAVRSEQVKNTLLGMMPQLQWVGVNTYGCRAVISVVERTIVTAEQTDSALYSIVADQDGIVSSVTITKGNALCKVGQAVRKGQLLVSPYTDCGLLIKAQSAEAEIYAQTNRRFTAITPSVITKRDVSDGEKIRFSLRIGNKIINFYKDSGILDTTCATMYEEKVLCLPGGFALPISLIKQTAINSVQTDIALPAELAKREMQSGLRKYLNTQMLSGKILYESYVPLRAQNSYSLQGEYICEEMIGKYRTEERFPSNG